MHCLLSKKNVHGRPPRIGSSGDCPWQLPKAHLDLLAESNGILVFHGYYRLFGLGPDAPIGVLYWNETTCWKFAWEKTAIENYLCFGETAWGDQYAYKINDLQRNNNPPVYFLEAINMQPELLANDFDAFVQEELLRCSAVPYDEMILKAFNLLGELPWDEHIAYVPPLLVSGDETNADIVKMGAVCSMIINGDLATQCADEMNCRNVKALTPYTDKFGRPRMRVEWV